MTTVCGTGKIVKQLKNNKSPSMFDTILNEYVKYVNNTVLTGHSLLHVAIELLTQPYSILQILLVTVYCTV